MKISDVKIGDTIRITTKENVPNATREFKVDAILPDGFLFGCSTTSDGRMIPFSWIESIRKANKPYNNYIVDGEVLKNDIIKYAWCNYERRCSSSKEECLKCEYYHIDVDTLFKIIDAFKTNKK